MAELRKAINFDESIMRTPPKGSIMEMDQEASPSSEITRTLKNVVRKRTH